MKTRYPIVLVHGLAMKDTFFMKSFGRIDRILRIQGYTVYKSDVDAFGTMEENADRLREEILHILDAEHAEKVNIIAHSKGGLDAKYMLAKLDMACHVASLTTLCTPHKGSPIASLVMRMPEMALKYAAFWVNLVYRLLGDQSPDSFRACQQLKRVDEATDETPPLIEGVFCQSFSATMHEHDKHQDFIMGIPAFFSRWMEKGVATDGLVPKDSAIYGIYRGDCVRGSVSHTEIVDFMVWDKRRDRIYAFYSALCEELSGMGL